MFKSGKGELKATVPQTPTSKTIAYLGPMILVVAWQKHNVAMCLIADGYTSAVVLRQIKLHTGTSRQSNVPIYFFDSYETFGSKK